MGHNALDSSEGSTQSSAKTLASELSKGIVSESFNEIFKQATGKNEALPGLHNQEELEKILAKHKQNDADKTKAPGDSQGQKQSGKHEKKDSIDVSSDGLYKTFVNTGMEDLIKDVLKSMADSKAAEDRQHKIAEKAMKDPTVQQVREVHNGEAVATVVIERKDGSVETHKPDGTKITETRDGVKETVFPKSVDAKIGSVIEYPNGAVETKNRDGSWEFVPPPPNNGEKRKYEPDGTETITKKDGTQIISRPDKSQAKIEPDGTKTTRFPDNTEIVEKPNGDRTVSKPDKIDANGNKSWQKNDGTEIIESKDGTRTTIYPESVNDKVQSKTEHPNGDLEQVMRDGTIIKISHEGGIEVINKDGSGTKINEKGEIETRNSDGSKISIKENGTIRIDNADTSTIFHSAGVKETIDHKTHTRTIETSDGKKATIYPDGTVEWSKKRHISADEEFLNDSMSIARRIARGGFTGILDD